MYRFRFVLPAAVICGGFLINAVPSLAKKEYTMKEKKPCSFCHKTAAPKDGKALTAAGEYYKVHKTLVGFKATK